MSDDPHTEILESLAELKGEIKTIGARLETGANTMKDHETRIRTNKEDIHGIADNGRALVTHLKTLSKNNKELNETLKEIKPFSDFIRTFAKVAAWCSIVGGGLFVIYQMLNPTIPPAGK